MFYGYVSSKPIINTDVYGLYPSDFYAAEDVISDEFSERGFAVPDIYNVETPTLEDYVQGRLGYTLPTWSSLFGDDNRITILDYGDDDTCLSDTEARMLFNTYVHETLHYNQGVYVDYLIISYSSENYEYGVKDGIGDVLHNKIYEAAKGK